MNTDILVRIFEHNNWANLKIIQVCSALSAEHLDAEPHSATYGSIRQVLVHLVSAQQGYFSLLSVPLEHRLRTKIEFSDLEKVARASGEGLLALASGAAQSSLTPPLQTMDDHRVEPWVVMVQAINHATEHREQIKSMLTALGITPPDIDGWDYGWDVQALVPIEK